MAYELSSSVKYVNPILGFYTEGPWTSVSDANANIDPAIRVQGMACKIIIAGVAHIYWYRDGILGTDLVEFTSGVSTFSALTDSPYDNTGLATALNSKQDRLAGIVSGCEITVETFSGTPVATNKQIKVSKGLALTNSWYIPTFEYSKLADTVSAEITLCPTGGDFKYYDIVADNTNAITIHEGTPSTAPAHYVIDPATEVLLGFITVGDAVIEEPTPVVGGFIPLTGTDEMSGVFQTGPDTDPYQAKVIMNGSLYDISVHDPVNLSRVSVFPETIRFESSVNNLLNRAWSQTIDGPYIFQNDILIINESWNIIESKIDAATGSYNPLITKRYADDHYAPIGGSTTNLSITNRTATTLDVASSTGTDATIPAASTTEAGLKTAADKTKSDKYPSTATNRTVLKGNGSSYVEITMDQLATLQANAGADITAGVVPALGSADLQYIRLTSASTTGLGGVASGVSGKDLFIFNDTGNSLTIQNEYGSSSASDRIICGVNLSWANQQILHLKYDSSESRWIVVSLGGSTYRPNLSGTGVRLVETSATGEEQAIIQTLDIDFTGPQQTSATSATWTGVNEVNIAGLLQGQLYIDYATTGYRYECHRNDWCSRTPVINVEVFTTNSLYPIFEVTGTSGTFGEDEAYVLNNASLVTMSLPLTGTLGKVIVVNGKGAGGWKITVPNTQQIVGGLTNSTTAGSGYIEATGATKQYAAVTLKCIVGGTAAKWAIVSTNPATTLTIA